MSDHILDHVPVVGKIAGEVVALGAIAGTFMEKLPYIAAGVAILWHMLLIYDWVRCKIGSSRRKGDNKNKKE